MRGNRARSTVLLAAAAWTIWVWVTRMWNILHDHDPAHGVAFKSVHSALAVISVAFAVAIGVIGVRMRREAGTPALQAGGRQPVGRS